MFSGIIFCGREQVDVGTGPLGGARESVTHCDILFRLTPNFYIQHQDTSKTGRFKNNFHSPSVYFDTLSILVLLKSDDCIEHRDTSRTERSK